MEDIEVPFQWDEDNHNILPVPHFKAPSRCRQSSSFFSCPPLLFFHWIQKDYQEQTLLKNIPVLAENVLTPLRTRRPRAPSLTEDKRRQMKSSIALLLNTGRKKQTKKKQTCSWSGKHKTAPSRDAVAEKHNGDRSEETHSRYSALLPNQGQWYQQHSQQNMNTVCNKVDFISLKHDSVHVFVFPLMSCFHLFLFFACETDNSRSLWGGTMTLQWSFSRSTWYITTLTMTTGRSCYLHIWWTFDMQPGSDVQGQTVLFLFSCKI